MRKSAIKAGDVVECDVRGRRFYSLVEACGQDSDVVIRPLSHNVTYRQVSARQVITVFRKLKSS